VNRQRILIQAAQREVAEHDFNIGHERLKAAAIEFDLAGETVLADRIRETLRTLRALVFNPQSGKA
jgi:hypothetical protein